MAIKQIFVEEYPLLLNVAEFTDDGNDVEDEESIDSMSILLNNPENAKLIKGKRLTASLLPLLRLQISCVICIFSIASFPPLDSGILWSTMYLVTLPELGYCRVGILSF